MGGDRVPTEPKGRLAGGSAAPAGERAASAGVHAREGLLLALILIVAATLRLYGLDWDGGHWLHPDERQIYFVALDLDWPRSLAQALSSQSPLNPGFFAYGSLPIYLVRIVAALLAPLWPLVRDPDNLHMVGRPLAALTDLGTVYLTYRLARRLGPSPRKEGSIRWVALLAAALVGLAVLHVQLAHFYTADPPLTFFVMLTLNLGADLVRQGGRARRLALGVALGLALACKISAAPLTLAVLYACYAEATPAGPRASRAPARWWPATRRALPALALAGIVFLLTQPYALLDWRTFVEHTIRESSIAWGRLDVPYTRQYAGTLPYLYPMWQTALWGLALPLGLVAWTALAACSVRWLRRGRTTDSLLLVWAGPYLAITGLLHAHYLRYMLPLLPLLCLLAAQFPGSLTRHRTGPKGRWVRGVAYAVIVIGSLVYALDFVGIYATRHSWISASEWIYHQVPAGSTLAVEDWDVALPLPLDLDGQPRRIEEYDIRTLTLYDEPDGAAKWQALAGDLADADYAIVASRRLYGSIPRLSDRYPVTTRYYDLLFAGDLGFELVAEFVRGPTWLNPRVAPLPGAAPALFLPDESFVVYDHPRALIWRNTGLLSAEEILQRLGIQ